MYTPYQNTQQPQQQQQQQYQYNQYDQYNQQQQQTAPGLQHVQPQHVAGGQQFYSNQQGYVPQQGQQPQHQSQQQGVPQPSQNQDGFGNFFSDPATSMAAQFAKNSFGQLNTYIQQNFGTFIPGTSNIKYYFKVSNSYVLRKISLILFPYRHLNWNRIAAGNSQVDSNGNPVTVNDATSKYLPPTHDVNAPDLYVPLMAFVTYILLWSVFQGLKGDFHPQLFASLALLVFACLIMDILVFRAGLYFLNATDFVFWDVVAYSSYKYVSVIVLLCLRQVISNSLLYFVCIVVMVANLGLFLMRTLRFMVLPSGFDHSNSISTSQRRMRLQVLFGYAVVVQAILIWYMSS